MDRNFKLVAFGLLAFLLILLLYISFMDKREQKEGIYTRWWKRASKGKSRARKTKNFLRKLQKSSLS
jgi:hypothetical protein